MPYRIPVSYLLPRLPSLLAGSGRPLREDIWGLFRATGLHPRVLGHDSIPDRDPFLAVVNHFHRPDIPAWWLVMADLLAIADRRVGTGLPPPIAVTATQWTYTNRLGRTLLEPGSRFIFQRILRAYGLIGMEPPALGDEAIEQRARSIRRVVEAARAAARHGGVMLIAPEGGDFPGGVLVRPPAGAGRLLKLLDATGLPFLPMAAWAEGDQILVSVGTRFRLKDALGGEHVSKEVLDERALRASMGPVAALLPPHLRGYYA